MIFSIIWDHLSNWENALFLGFTLLIFTKNCSNKHWLSNKFQNKDCSGLGRSRTGVNFKPGLCWGCRPGRNFPRASLDKPVQTRLQTTSRTPCLQEIKNIYAERTWVFKPFMLSGQRQKFKSIGHCWQFLTSLCLFISPSPPPYECAGTGGGWFTGQSH